MNIFGSSLQADDVNPIHIIIIKRLHSTEIIHIMDLRMIPLWILVYMATELICTWSNNFEEKIYIIIFCRNLPYILWKQNESVIKLPTVVFGRRGWPRCIYTVRASSYRISGWKPEKKKLQEIYDYLVSSFISHMFCWTGWRCLSLLGAYGFDRQLAIHTFALWSRMLMPSNPLLVLAGKGRSGAAFLFISLVFFFFFFFFTCSRLFVYCVPNNEPCFV